MEKEKTRQYLIKLGCVLASFILWLYVYNFVNPTKTIKLRDVPVQITNEEALSQLKLVMLPSEKYTLTLDLHGSTVDLDKVSKNDFKLIADLNGYGIRKGEINKIPVYIVKKPDSVQVTNSDMLYINIRTDNYVEKNFQIVPDLKGKAKSGYYYQPTSFEPSTVTVSGAERYVNQVNAVYGTVNLSNSISNVEGTVSLRAVDDSGDTVSNVKISPSTCSAVTVIKKVKTVGVNVKTKGEINKNLILKSISPINDKVEVIIEGNDENSNITTLDTEPYDLSTISDNKDIQLTLVLPEGVKMANGNGVISAKVLLSKIIQKNYAANIKTNNLGNNLNVALDHSNVSVTLSGEEDGINKIKNEDIDCSVDLTNLNEEKDYNLNVNVKIPNGVTLVSATPSSVKATITKK